MVTLADAPLGLNPEKSVSEDSAALSWPRTGLAYGCQGLGLLVFLKPLASFSQPPPPGKGSGQLDGLASPHSLISEATALAPQNRKGA